MTENFPKYFRPLRLLEIGEGGLMISFHPIIYGNKIFSSSSQNFELIFSEDIVNINPKVMVSLVPSMF